MPWWVAPRPSWLLFRHAHQQDMASINAHLPDTPRHPPLSHALQGEIVTLGCLSVLPDLDLDRNRPTYPLLDTVVVNMRLRVPLEIGHIAARTSGPEIEIPSLTRESGVPALSTSTIATNTFLTTYGRSAVQSESASMGCSRAEPTDGDRDKEATGNLQLRQRRGQICRFPARTSTCAL